MGGGDTPSPTPLPEGVYLRQADNARYWVNNQGKLLVLQFTNYSDSVISYELDTTRTTVRLVNELPQDVLEFGVEYVSGGFNMGNVTFEYAGVEYNISASNQTSTPVVTDIYPE